MVWQAVVFVNWRNEKMSRAKTVFLFYEEKEEKAWDYSCISSCGSYMMLFRQRISTLMLKEPVYEFQYRDSIKENQKCLDKLYVELFLSMSFKINKLYKLCNSKLWICCYSHYEYLMFLK